ncbi:hypothetical protein BC828DRAFT_388658 [Blastocladiella britannica]|nr:hypothetical protein BC828DRAFT_388658 [Blastocladiella britannica]
MHQHQPQATVMKLIHQHLPSSPISTTKIAHSAKTTTTQWAATPPPSPPSPSPRLIDALLPVESALPVVAPAVDADALVQPSSTTVLPPSPALSVTAAPSTADSMDSEWQQPQQRPRRSVSFAPEPEHSVHEAHAADEYERADPADAFPIRLKFADVAALMALRSLMRRQHARAGGSVGEAVTCPCTACGSPVEGIEMITNLLPPTLDEMEENGW